MSLKLADCRPEVQAFALLMEGKLRENDHKGGWKDNGALSLFRRLIEESAELDRAIRKSAETAEIWQARVGAEAADVGNFAMMIADVCGALPSPGGDTGKEAP